MFSVIENTTTGGPHSPERVTKEIPPIIEVGLNPEKYQEGLSLKPEGTFVSDIGEGCQGLKEKKTSPGKRVGAAEIED